MEERLPHLFGVERADRRVDQQPQVGLAIIGILFEELVVGRPAPEAGRQDINGAVGRSDEINRALGGSPPAFSPGSGWIRAYRSWGTWTSSGARGAWQLKPMTPHSMIA